MKLTCVTAVFNAIKSGNRENLIRCVRSVAALKTEHEHLIYDGGSTDGTVELLRELEREVNGDEEKIGGENRWTKDGLISDCCACEGTRTTGGGESGSAGVRALPKNDNSTVHLFSTPVFSHPRLRVVSEPDTGIYNALNKGVRDAQGEWFYVLGCDDYISHPDVLDRYLEEDGSKSDAVCAALLVKKEDGSTGPYFSCMKDLQYVLWDSPAGHQGELIRTQWARELGGFDEQYVLAADGDMFFKAHYRGLKFSYHFESFAVFACGGASSSVSELRSKKGYKSYVDAAAKCLGLSDEETTRLKKDRTLPVGKCLRLLFHRDLALRMGARFVLRNKFLNAVRNMVRVLTSKVEPS